ncbi:MAG TPA: hypothetical protein VFC78_15245 [Tepidisphaeraceae bacterium]|nr:hypothetical protein [Tepidisphaeraceae bacterium]
MPGGNALISLAESGCEVYDALVRSRAFMLMSVLSLVLCAASCALWATSYRSSAKLDLVHERLTRQGYDEIWTILEVDRGCVGYYQNVSKYDLPRIGSTEWSTIRAQWEPRGQDVYAADFANRLGFAHESSFRVGRGGGYQDSTSDRERRIVFPLWLPSLLLMILPTILFWECRKRRRESDRVYCRFPWTSMFSLVLWAPIFALWATSYGALATLDWVRVQPMATGFNHMWTNLSLYRGCIGYLRTDSRSNLSVGVNGEWSKIRLRRLPLNQLDSPVALKYANGWGFGYKNLTYLEAPQYYNAVSETYRGLVVPLWLPLLLLSILPIIQFRKYARRKRQSRDGCCLSCGYDLRASPDRCPECGRQTHPAKRKPEAGVSLGH